MAITTYISRDVNDTRPWVVRRTVKVWRGRPAFRRESGEFLQGGWAMFLGEIQRRDIPEEARGYFPRNPDEFLRPGTCRVLEGEENEVVLHALILKYRAR